MEEVVYELSHAFLSYVIHKWIESKLFGVACHNFLRNCIIPIIIFQFNIHAYVCLDSVCPSFCLPDFMCYLFFI